MFSSAISSSETFANRLLAAILALYKLPRAVYVASYKGPLDQSDCWKLFVQKLYLNIYMLNAFASIMHKRPNSNGQRSFY